MEDMIRNRLKTFIPPESRWTPADRALYGVEDIYRVEKAVAEKLRLEALKYSFAHHYEHNGFYRRYCQGEGITPDKIKETPDLARIPLIPDTFFKNYPSGAEFLQWLQKIATAKPPDVTLKKRNPSFEYILDALQEKNFTVTFTSGSSGKFSFFPRDEITWMRQQYCFALSVADVLRSEYAVENPDMVCLSAFYNPDKTHMFTGRVSSALYGTLFDWKDVVLLIDRKLTTNSIRIAMGRTKGIGERIIYRLAAAGRKRIVARCIKMLEGYAAEGRKVLIGAPPFFVDALLASMEEQGKKLNLGRNGWVITGGGWKSQKDKYTVINEFKQRMEKLLGVPAENWRDLLGMSECSAFFPGCQGHYKHIPHSICYPLVLDDELKPVGYGRYGRFALLDPLPTSYPGFIITGDKVKMLESCPVCDRQGPVIDPDMSRITGVEGRGCANIVRELMAGEIARIAGR